MLYSKFLSSHFSELKFLIFHICLVSYFYFSYLKRRNIWFLVIQKPNPVISWNVLKWNVKKWWIKAECFSSGNGKKKRQAITSICHFLFDHQMSILEHRVHYSIFHDRDEEGQQDSKVGTRLNRRSQRRLWRFYRRRF